MNGTNSKGAVLDGNGAELTKNLYNDVGGTTTEVRNSNNSLKYHVFYDKLSGPPGPNIDAVGNIMGYRVDAGGHSTDYTYGYELGDSYRQKTTTGVKDGQTGITTNKYDANGYLISVDGDDEHDANDRTFVNDAAGKLLYARQGTHAQRQLIVNGEVLGRYGEIVDDKEPRDNDGVPVFTTVATFGFGFMGTGGNTPKLSDSTYVVGSGDTLEGIAKATYGDSRLWYRIAEANGLSSNADLRAGQVLKVPGTEVNGNDANTFRPYRPGEVIGDTSPHIPQPPPKKASMFGMLLMIVVAVIATIFTAGALTGVMAQGFMATMSAGASALSAGAVGAGIATAATATAAGTLGLSGFAIAGAVGSIASQAVGLATGQQDEFSWKQVALGAIGSAAGGAAGNLVKGLEGAAQAVVRGAVGNVIAQGVGVATGLQDKFSWTGVAASAAGAGVGQVVGSALDSAGAFNGLGDFANLARGTASGFMAGATAAIMRGGKISVKQVMVDAFGQAIGQALAASSTSAVTAPQAGSEDVLGDFIAKNNNWAHVDVGVIDGRVNGRTFEEANAWRAQNNPYAAYLRAGRSQSMGAGPANIENIGGNELQPDYETKGDAFTAARDAAGRRGLVAMRDRAPDSAARAEAQALANKYINLHSQALAINHSILQQAVAGGFDQQGQAAAAKQAPMSAGSLEDHSLYVKPGFVTSSFNGGSGMMYNSQLPWHERIIGGVAATGMFPLMLLDEAGRALFNVPYHGSQMGQNAAQFSLAKTNEERVVASLKFTQNATSGILGASVLVPASVSMKAPILTAEEMAVQQFSGAAAVNEARLTYQIAETTSPFVVPPTKQAVRELKTFGMDTAQRRAFFEGRQVIFEDPSTHYPTASIFQLEKNTLHAGIWDLISDGNGAITSFANRSRSLGNTLGVQELELFGADIRNDRLKNIMMRRGFEEGPPVFIDAYGFSKHVPTLRRTESLGQRQ